MSLLLDRQHVVQEHRARSDEFVKLAKFMGSFEFEAVNPEEKKRLHRQILIMSDLVDILQERIDAFPKGGA